MRLGFVGAGNMAQALFSPLNEFIKKTFQEVIIYTPTKTRAEVLAKELSGKVAADLNAIEVCDVVILAHKPQQLNDVCSKLSLKKDASIISILASIETEQIKRLFGVNQVLRLMPNTPAQVGEGVITYFCQVSAREHFTYWINAFSEHSRLEEFVDEGMIDLTTPELGSGPGIVLEMIRIFSESLEKKGLSPKRAAELSAAVFKGSGELVLKSKDTPGELRDKVTSKGGITFECLKVLGDNSLEKTLHQSFKAGHNRSIELKK